MLGTLLEKTIMKTKFELDGSIKYPAMPVPILETQERQMVMDKIKEIVRSLSPLEGTVSPTGEVLPRTADVN